LAPAIDRGDDMPRLELILLPSASAGGYNAQRLLSTLRRGVPAPGGMSGLGGAVLDQQGVRLETAIGRASPPSEAGALRPGLGPVRVSASGVSRAEGGEDNSVLPVRYPASAKTGPRRFLGRFFVVVYDTFLPSSQELTHAGPGTLSPCSCFTGVSVKRKLTLSLMLIVNQRLVTFDSHLTPQITSF